MTRIKDNNMIKAFLSTLTLVVSLLFLNFTSIDNDTPLFVQVENLSPELFKGYLLGSLENEEIEIVETCVPARVLCVKHTGNSEIEGAQIVKEFFMQNNQSGKVEILTDCDMEEFQNKCANARLGR